jgi:hypothetical protein
LLNHITGPKHAHVNRVRARFRRFRAKLQKQGIKSNCRSCGFSAHADLNVATLAG